MLAQLGTVVFDARNLPYQQRQRATEWRHPQQQRTGAAPVAQFAGKGADTLTLSGLLYPQLTSGPVSLDALRALADTGEAQLLVDGSGRIHGRWNILRVQETQTHFFADGTAKRIEFGIDLQRQPDDAIDGLDGVTSQFANTVAGALR